MVSMSSSAGMREGLIPIIYGRGEQQKSMRAFGSTGMKTCCEGKEGGREGGRRGREGERRERRRNGGRVE